MVGYRSPKPLIRVQILVPLPYCQVVKWYTQRTLTPSFASSNLALAAIFYKRGGISRMDNLKVLRTTSTIELVEKLTKNIEGKNQSMVNLIAYELTTRIYIPASEMSFDDILYSFGYQTELQQEKKLIKK